MSNSNTEKILVKCCKCGVDIYVLPKTVRRHARSNSKGFKCKKCLSIESKERYANLSVEEKERRAKISKSKMEEYWSRMSTSDKEKRLDALNTGFRNYTDNMSDDERKKMNATLSKAQSKRWKNMDPDKKKSILEALHAGSSAWYNNLSDEEKVKFHTHIQNGNKKWWDSLSDDEKSKYAQIRKYAADEYWKWAKNNPDIMREISDRQSKNIKKFWDSMTEYEYKVWDIKRQNGLDQYLNNLPYMGMNINECSFANYMNNFKFKYDHHWYNKIEHPEFSKLFPYNPVTKSTSVSPYHQWDFIIHTLDGDVLIDIDGSIHDINSINHSVKYFNGSTINLSDIIKFNDSKRPYQTDGLPAYVVICYDDKMTLNTPVQNIVTGEVLDISKLISTLIWMNTCEKDKKEMIRLAFKK